jgi:hypothetical protein
MAAPLYPTIEDVFNLTRVIINDAFSSGAGRIFIDTWTPNLTILNLAIQTYQRDIEDSGVAALRKETIITGLPSITGGEPDPAILCRLGFDGYDDGSGSVNTSYKLPTDCILPYELWQRNNGTSLTFSIVAFAAGHVPSQYQDYSLGQWEFRSDSIYFNGSLVTKDVQIRYQASAATVLGTSTANFSTTKIELMDCLEPLAYRTAYIFSMGRAGSNPNTAALLAHYERAKNAIVQRYLRAQQFATWEKEPYGQTGDLFGWFG